MNLNPLAISAVPVAAPATAAALLIGCNGPFADGPFSQSGPTLDPPASGSICQTYLEELVAAENVPSQIDLAGMVAMSGTRTQDYSWWTGEVETNGVSITVAFAGEQVIHQTLHNPDGELCSESWLANVAVDITLTGTYTWLTSFPAIRDIARAPVYFQGVVETAIWDTSLPIPGTLVQPVESVIVDFWWPEEGQPYGDIQLQGNDDVVEQLLSFGHLTRAGGR